MTTAAQVQAAYAAANRGQTLDTATATATAAQIDASGGTFTLNGYISQQFEANQNSTGLALEIFQAIVGKTESNAADLTTITNTVKGFLTTYTNSGVSSANLPQAAADDLGAQLADNAIGATFRANNNLTGLYAPAAGTTPSTATFDVGGFVTNWLTNVYGAAAVTGTALNFESARFLELANRYKGFADANDPTGYVRAAGALVAELINQGEQANNGNYHNAALAFITADANGTAPYGSNLLASSGTGTGSGGSGATTGIAGNIYTLTQTAAGAAGDTVPLAALPNTNDDYINGSTANSLGPNDNINGGNGLDIMFAKLDPATGGTANNPLQSNVQNVELQFYQNISAATVQTIDLSLNQGAQQVWDAGSTSGFTFTNVASSNAIVSQQFGISGGPTSTLGGAGVASAAPGAHVDTITLANGVTNATLNFALDNAGRYVAQAAGGIGAALPAGNVSDSLVTTGVKVENILLQTATGNALVSNPDSTFNANGGQTFAAGSNVSALTIAPTDSVLTNVAIKGAGALALTINNVAGVNGSLLGIDSSALTTATSSTTTVAAATAVVPGITFSGVTVDISNLTNPNFKFVGGAGGDEVKTAATVTQVVQGNGGADFYDLSAGNGGAGTSHVTVKIAAASDSTTLATDTILNFHANSGANDKIDVAALGFTGANAVTGTIKTIAGGGPGSSDVAGFFTQPATGSQIIYDTAAAKLYLDSNHDGAFNAATDTVINLSGLVGTLKAADFIFA